MRGKPSDRLRSAIARGLIPAHAGKTTPGRSHRHQPGLIPAHAGKTSAISRGSSTDVGSSPLMRGKQQSSRQGHHLDGLIPIHAGKTSCATGREPFARAHPRSCEENAHIVDVGGALGGSSPLMRGKLPAHHRPWRVHGLIPAHTGKTAAMSLWDTLTWAHPRSRGENSNEPPSFSRSPGSSPLTRGKLAVDGGLDGIERLIPAHAGKTPEAAIPRSCQGAHPRSRGENYGPETGHLVGTGSSPLTRGKRGVPDRVGERDRLIPAHAGKTKSPSGCQGFGWAHPRSRGENRGMRPSGHSSGGSSQLTRGKHGMRGPLRRPLGLIPAHAGKTN